MKRLSGPMVAASLLALALLAGPLVPVAAAQGGYQVGVQVHVTNTTPRSIMFQLHLQGIDQGWWVVEANDTWWMEFMCEQALEYRGQVGYHCADGVRYDEDIRPTPSLFMDINCPALPPPTCLLAGTPIMMADGTTRAIESLSIGDRILAFDANGSHTALAPITTTFHHASSAMAGSYLVINGTLRITPDHVMYINGRWVGAGTARVGDRMLGVNGKPVPIVSIETVNDRVPTFNLEVEGLHTFFAAGVLVHNSKLPSSAE